MDDDSLAPTRAHPRELLDPRESIERVAPEEVLRAVDRPALAFVLVAPVLADLRSSWEVEIEVGREACGPGRTCEHHAEDVRVLVLADQPA